MEHARSSPNLLQLAVIALVIFASLACFVVSFNTGDLLWFDPRFDELPISMTVHCYGQQVDIMPGEAAYEVVNAAINESLTGQKRWDSLTMSDVTYEEYQKNPTSLVIEINYNPPVRIHSIYKFYKNINILIIPLDARHAAYNTVFGRAGENVIAGSMHVKSTAPIIQALEEQHICKKQ